jgi:hypothetical protein
MEILDPHVDPAAKWLVDDPSNGKIALQTENGKFSSWCRYCFSGEKNNQDMASVHLKSIQDNCWAS